MRAHDERGDSLIEVLVAVMIVGVGVTGILGALGTGISLAGVNREQSAAEALVREYAEAVKAAPLVPCGTVGAYTGLVTAPADLTILVPTVTCPVGSLTQTVTVGVRASDARVGDLTLDVVKRSVP